MYYSNQNFTEASAPWCIFDIGNLSTNNAVSIDIMSLLIFIYFTETEYNCSTSVQSAAGSVCNHAGMASQADKQRSTAPNIAIR